MANNEELNVTEATYEEIPETEAIEETTEENDDLDEENLVEVSDLDSEESKGISPLLVAAAAGVAYIGFKAAKKGYGKLKDKLAEKKEEKSKKVKLTKEQKALAEATFEKLLAEGYSPEDATEEFELLQRNAEALPKVKSEG